jgi:hypothetical protein
MVPQSQLGQHVCVGVQLVRRHVRRVPPSDRAEPGKQQHDARRPARAASAAPASGKADSARQHRQSHRDRRAVRHDAPDRAGPVGHANQRLPLRRGGAVDVAGGARRRARHLGPPPASIQPLDAREKSAVHRGANQRRNAAGLHGVVGSGDTGTQLQARKRQPVCRLTSRVRRTLRARRSAARCQRCSRRGRAFAR